MRFKVLDIPIDAVTADQALEFVVEALAAGRRGLFVATPNPEMLVAASHDREFADVLRKSDLNIADGFGVLLAAHFQGTPLPGRVPGVEFMERLMAWAGETGRTAFLLGGSDGVAASAALKLAKKYSGLEFVGAMSGGKVRRTTSGEWQADDEVVGRINEAKPDLLFVAFGHGKQEGWIDANLRKMPSVGLAMGVGGSFDFIAGRAKRAPLIMRQLGLEWLWRLHREPRRWRRIIDACVVFPWLVLTSGRRYNK